MTTAQILNIGTELTKRRLRTPLFQQLKEVRPSLAWDTLYRAFKDPECKTDILNWIRDEARMMLAGKGVEIEAQALEAA